MTEQVPAVVETARATGITPYGAGNEDDVL
jgi:hypothetical protein